MKKIEEMRKEVRTWADFYEKINELVKVVNGFYEDSEVLEGPIYETLAPDEVLIISKSKDGLLVARNEGGRVFLEHVSLDEEKEKKEDG